MDYLFDTALTKIPKDYLVSCYFIVDNHLWYVSLYREKYFRLHYVDSFKVEELLKESTNEYEFDAYVLSVNRPIKYMECKFDTIHNTEVRVVTVKTESGNPKIRKSKKAEERTIITRYSSNNKNKLF